MESSRALPRGRHRLSREEVEGSQRERMLDAIVELVAAHGYARTTVGGIAAQAGVSRTTFYEQFDTKEDCFQAAYDAVVAQLVEAIVEASTPVDDPRKSLAAGIETYLQWLADHPAAATAFVVEVHTAGPQALEQRADVLQRFCAVIDENVPEARPAAVMAVITSIDAMAHEVVRKGKAAKLPKLTDDARHIASKLLS